MLERCNTDMPKMHEEDKPSCVENVAEEVKEFVEQFLQDEKKVEKSNIQNLKPMQFIQWGKQESVPAVILKKIEDSSYDVNFFTKSEMGWIKNELVQNVKAEDVCLKKSSCLAGSPCSNLICEVQSAENQQTTSK